MAKTLRSFEQMIYGDISGDASLTVWTQSQQFTKSFLCKRLWRNLLVRTHTGLRLDLRHAQKVHKWTLMLKEWLFVRSKPPTVHIEYDNVYCWKNM